MAEWAFSDGSVLRSGGAVDGDSVLAATLREAIDVSKSGIPRTVAVAQLPDGYWPLDIAQDFTLNALAREVAYSQRATVTTEYVEGDDVPAEVKELRDLESEPDEIN